MPETNPLITLLDAIADPGGRGGLIASGRASAPRISGGKASLILDVTGLSASERDALDKAVHAAIETLPDVTEIRVAMTQEKVGRRLIAVGSGKGGVGKSTLAANLAVALARLGRRVGLIDADIYGPSQPRLMDSEGARPTAKDQKLDPVPTRFGVPMLSMGHLVKPGQAVAWRGPMAGNALGQLIDADWGQCDLLIVDLPPGTGDVQLSMIQKHKPAGAIIVSTPQDLALIDAARAIDLFNQSTVPIIGLVENMAGYQCPKCGEISDPFGHGGAEAAAKQMGHAFLGRIPLDIAIRSASDDGTPPAAGDGPAAAAFNAIAQSLITWLDNQER
ncbi:MAG: Mrp/NBP35 family ATP-binding protein [Sphingomonadales bacterium]|jgi:ATP-binding protein involved in chromosome partitioning|nr:Mrp/NBP35 family ATP-binding protein [Sphingomonadales bacterium]MBP7135273.1 Mrp/NBP35 family ATP-binding protein [Sphingomonadaceae bacterium]MBK6492060.1 Mrp/NBP35 family ATP-binding protein [Sphingomonadales bacterium]MBK6718527.1 Mrp/NBP35 family ATP-binding protein [Sphingomonadales bacterium]MBK8272453.1 Mrp/NBP35 family ATP-binding protein [Sphingomonadales bacterium]